MKRTEEEGGRKKEGGRKRELSNEEGGREDGGKYLKSEVKEVRTRRRRSRWEKGGIIAVSSLPFIKTIDDGFF